MEGKLLALAGRNVSELMSREAVCVGLSQTMAEAADVLTENRVTGCPVVDELGKCIGVLTSSDFVHAKAEEIDGSTRVGDYVLSADDSGVFSVGRLGHDLVKTHMSSAVQSIASDADLLSAARRMSLSRMHRLIVVDDASRPVGVVTSLDLVRAIVEALQPKEEGRQRKGVPR
ncbi:MAG: CBS domain-containing protein [Planctomycetota bacterium]